MYKLTQEVKDKLQAIVAGDKVYIEYIKLEVEDYSGLASPLSFFIK